MDGNISKCKTKLETQKDRQDGTSVCSDIVNATKTTLSLQNIQVSKETESYKIATC